LTLPRGGPHRSIRATTAFGAVVAMLAVGVGGDLASAQTKGSGGVGTPDPPQLLDATCMDGCAGLRTASVGSKIVLSGRSLAAITEVSFSRDGGGRVSVQPDSATPDQVVAKVPGKASSGAPRVADSYGQSADSPQQIEIVSPNQTAPSGPFRLQQASVTSPTVFYAGKKKAQVQFVFNGDNAQDVRVDVVNRDSGQVVRSMVVPDVTPGQPATARWNGLGSGRDVAPNGNYKFTIAPVSGGQGEDGDGATDFSFYGFKFPIPQGKHTYGDGVGAARGGGRVHQGQDVLADCGLPLVAVRAGTIQAEGYDGAGGGNYLVLDAKNDEHDYVYMHLRDAPLVKTGEKVKTGQKVGYVGDTGDATACHLHFEMWSAPGYYEGGDYMPEVTRYLKKWDSWS
jgi:murein DD-endopeptidase MepM/ murein hydrolase activator NlpD